MTQKAYQDESKAAATDAQSPSAASFTAQQPASHQDAAVARPYAEALFRVAVGQDANVKESTDTSTSTKKSALSHWSSWLAVLAQVAAHQGVRGLNKNPNIEPAQIEAMVTQLAPFPRSSAAEKEAAAHFLHLLITRHRLDALPEIAHQFEALRSAHEGVADAEILTAFPLDAATLKTLLTALEHRFGRPLKPHVRVEPALIGGVCVTVGDEVLDTSVRAKLAELHDHLMK